MSQVLDEKSYFDFLIKYCMIAKESYLKGFKTDNL
jgi:hypothetical protein